MKPINTRIWRLIRPDPLTASVLIGASGRVYTVAELDEQPPAPPRSTDARPSVLGEAEALFQEVFRLKLKGYRYR